MTPPVAPSSTCPVWAAPRDTVGRRAKCRASPHGRCGGVGTVGRSWLPTTTTSVEKKKRCDTGGNNTHLETDTGKRKHVALARDGAWHAVVVFDEGEDQLGCHPARRSREQRRAQLGGAQSGVGERELLDDRRQPEIRNQRIPLVADENVGLERERRQLALDETVSGGERTPLRSPWITTGFMLWR